MCITLSMETFMSNEGPFCTKEKKIQTISLIMHISLIHAGVWNLGHNKLLPLALILCGMLAHCQCYPRSQSFWCNYMVWQITELACITKTLILHTLLSVAELPQGNILQECWIFIHYFYFFFKLGFWVGWGFCSGSWQHINSRNCAIFMTFRF